MKSIIALILWMGIGLNGTDSEDNNPATLKVKMTWGYTSPGHSVFYVKLESNNMQITKTAGYACESSDEYQNGIWQTHAGGGDVDGVDFTLNYTPQPVKILQNLHIIWADLIAQSDVDTAQRLTQDPAYRIDTRKLTVQMNPEGTRGFSVTLDQLLKNQGIWIPELDVFLSTGESPISFAEHQKQLTSWNGRRILDLVHQEPEAAYQQYTARWEDMGSPGYIHPNQPKPGHIVGLAWDSSIPKFGIDRGAGVWNDYGNPDHFRFWFDFGDLSQGIAKTWKSQKLLDGLPIIITTFEKSGVRYEIEQFAYPLHGPPSERQGDIPMVLCQKIKITELLGKTQLLPVALNHLRKLTSQPDSEATITYSGNHYVCQDCTDQNILFTIDGLDGIPAWCGVQDYQDKMKRINAVVSLNLPANGSRELVVKLPSPTVNAEDRDKLLSLNYAAARKITLDYWEQYLSRGAQFQVPENPVNELYQANLWHALRLPRRHGGSGKDVKIDLPYSNFAYDQTGTPWPVNQAVYVDYMIYDLRGYHDIAEEEIAAMYRNNQEANGHLTGNANWVVNTPGMLYAAAKHYLLSQDQKSWDRLLPPSLKAMDWCLEQIQKAQQRSGPTQGLIAGPLNDLTGDGIWAFNQAYLYAGLDLFGKALQQNSHPRAQECLNAAQKVYQAIDRGFHAAMMRSPLIQLRDHTWMTYVPCEAITYGRIFEQWYPTDVDTGALHLVRLAATPADGDLANALLNDHEDNLFLHGWGIANEPVYNQQATAYLLRDDPQAAIRTFYSYMASAFSHSVYEPVEHRWTHGQYFGPPSTDGAWAELYRNMLIRELDDGSLLLLQATPRVWLENGKKISVEQAPTYYGKISLTIESRTDSGKILADISMPERKSLKTLLVRFRHPQSRSIKSVTVNGDNWKDFDNHKEWIKIENPKQKHYAIITNYELLGT